LAVLLVAVGLPACSLKKLVADNMSGMLGEVETAFLDEPSYRYGREAGASLLKMLDGVIASSPKNRHLLDMGVRMQAQFAQAFAEGDDEAFARSLYEKAKDYGVRALKDPALNGSLEEVRAALQNHREKEVGRIFWTGLAYGGWINLNKDSVAAVADLPIAVAFMERVLELDPNFYHGGAHLFLGQYYGSRSPALGGDPAKAREHIEKAIAISDGKFLMSRIFLVRFVAVPTQDTAMFARELDIVLEAPMDILPGERLGTAVAKHQAAKLMDAAVDLFVVWEEVEE
jgi:tetratricopeptide (TPR) repeat protein